jgi:hypothetical protein
VSAAAWRDASRAPAQIDWRVIATGEVPRVKGLSYRATANFAFHDRMPYVVGPGSPTATAPVLSPVNRATLMVGLQYDLDVL